MATLWEPDDIETVLAQEDYPSRDLSSCTPERSVSLEIHYRVPDALLASEGSSDYKTDHPDHPGCHTSLDDQQYQYDTDTSQPVKSRFFCHSSQQPTHAQSSDLWFQTSHLPTEAPPSGFASSPELAEDVPATPQASASNTHQAPHHNVWAFAQPSPNQPLQGSFPPYTMLGHQPTGHVYTNPPKNVPFALLPRFISWIDEATVRDYLAIAVVRHRDIHDMVEKEYERIARERQDRINEDASVLSFIKEHTKVQKILYEEYDDFPNHMRQAIIHRAVSSINQTIMSIPLKVRASSNWKTKFNAFLTLVWIGRGIVNGIGMLPDAIKAQMAVDSKLVEAVRHVCATMSEPEILDDGARLLEALVDLNTDRGHCFEGLEIVVNSFEKVIKQGRTV
ncbi:hypothetical protein QM012_004666 [Aureobasidium pullulans]|uniref:Uncharacterized protein n=1 Tax=Aureobasidium pullulans TaxID=5580 RepID=A0ABR0TUT4_AURPU